MRLMAVLVVLVSWLGIAGATQPDPYVAGNAAAARGDHRAAIASFETAIRTQGWSTNALLGLANAYASVGDTGHAILALERARVLSPDDESVARNLAALRDRAAVAAPARSRIDRAVDFLPADDWAWLALGGLAAAAAGVAGIAWSRRRTIAVAVTLGGFAVGLGAGAIALRVAPDPAAAVVVSSAPATIAPFAGAEPAFSARAGEHVEVEQRRPGYVYVRADGQRAGWLPETSVASVIPPERGGAGT
jgi:tetratricopeptide (TPR) repeat protein